MRAIGSIIVYVLKEAVTDKLKVKLIEEMLSLETLNGHFQVIQALKHVLEYSRTRFNAFFMQA